MPAVASGPEYATVSDAERCQNEKISVDQQIAACLKNIASGGGFLTKETIAYDWYHLGKAYGRKDDHRNAVMAMNAAIKLYPRMWPAYTGRGAELYKLGSLDYALRDFATAISLNPRSGGALNSRCWFRVTNGRDLDAALADCNAALALEPKEAAILDSRGFVQFRRGQYGAAIDDCTAAIVHDSKMVTSLYVRGLAKVKSGDVAGGTADIAAAKAADPKIADTYASYGVTQ